MLFFPKGTLALYLSLSFAFALAAPATARLLDRMNGPSPDEHEGKVTPVEIPEYIKCLTNRNVIWKWRIICAYDGEQYWEMDDYICREQSSRDQFNFLECQEGGGKAWGAYCPERILPMPPIEFAKAASTKFLCSATSPVKDKVCTEGNSYDVDMDEMISFHHYDDICLNCKSGELCYRAEDCPP